MTSDAYYQPDLAWVHHIGYSDYVAQVRAGVVELLRAHGLSRGDRVLDVGCGSGLLARELLAAGFDVHGVDASPAMIELARDYAPGARFSILRLPTGLPPGAAGALPDADVIVSTGHVLNYLDTREDIALALGELARALRPAGVLAIDLMTERYCRRRDRGKAHARVADDFVVITRYSRPARRRLDRQITVFRRVGEHWRRSDEHHRNLSFEVDHGLRILRDNGIDAHARAAFGAEQLPEGLVVLAGRRH